MSSSENEGTSNSRKRKGQDKDISIFIIYRMDTGSHLAIFLRDYLRTKGYPTFVDDDMQTFRGSSCMQNTKDKITSCTHCIVLLTEGCLDSCNEPDDKFTRDIMVALSNTPPAIIPVFTEGFVFPNASEGNLDIAQLFQSCALKFDGEYNEATLERLENCLESWKNCI